MYLPLVFRQTHFKMLNMVFVTLIFFFFNNAFLSLQTCCRNIMFQSESEQEIMLPVSIYYLEKFCYH